MTHLDAMVRSEQFLRYFKPVDQVTRTASYREDFSIVGGEPGNRVLCLGPRPQAADTTDTISRFLDVLAAQVNRINAVAATLTVLLRHHWPGGKPLVLVTATKSHAGKGAGRLLECLRLLSGHARPPPLL